MFFYYDAKSDMNTYSVQLFNISVIALYYISVGKMFELSNFEAFMQVI